MQQQQIWRWITLRIAHRVCQRHGAERTAATIVCCARSHAHRPSMVRNVHQLAPAASRRCDPRATSIDLEDWDTGETVTLPLDPQKSAVRPAPTAATRPLEHEYADSCRW